MSINLNNNFKEQPIDFSHGAYQEPMIHTFGFLSHKEIYAVKLTCKIFKEFADKPRLYKPEALQLRIKYEEYYRNYGNRYEYKRQEIKNKLNELKSDLINEFNYINELEKKEKSCFRIFMRTICNPETIVNSISGIVSLFLPEKKPALRKQTLRDKIDCKIKNPYLFLKHPNIKRSNKELAALCDEGFDSFFEYFKLRIELLIKNDEANKVEKVKLVERFISIYNCRKTLSISMERLEGTKGLQIHTKHRESDYDLFNDVLNTIKMTVEPYMSNK